MPINRLSIILAMVFLTPCVYAELRPFKADSIQHIKNAHAGQDFVLLLWSLDCPPCIGELETLQKLKLPAATPRLVLVSTDGRDRQGEVEVMLERFGLSGQNNWLFAETYTERLRYKIDADWFGELPRSYRYDKNHQRIARSGVLDHETLTQWLLDPHQKTPPSGH